MRSPIATLAVAVLSVLLLAPAAAAAPTQVKVRVEGKSGTIFEGPILTDVHRVKGAGDSQWRRCDGINVNVPLNKVPSVVPTSATADAMRIVGETFDGQWYAQYEDYFLKRWGPDAQDEAANEYWGVLVNSVFTAVGGCQYQLDGGDEVLWVYNAFDGRPRLALYPAGYSGGAEPLTATATLNQPFEVEVDTWSTSDEGQPPAAPGRAGDPYAGAEVAPVATDSQGFQEVEVASPETVASGADGKASITFTTPGWHRIKATDFAAGVENAVRSNRLDVCVPAPPATDCGALPADDLNRTPPPPVAGEVDGETPEDEGPGSSPSDGSPSDGAGGAGGGGAAGGSSGSAGSKQAPPPAEPGPVRLQQPDLDRSRLAQGLVKVSWRVLDAGVGVQRWTIASQALGRKGAPWVNRAGGSERTTATLRLPRGRAYRLRLTVTDSLGRSASASLGRVQVPR
jgi:hypothetical protein